MNPALGADAVRRGEQPPLDSALRHSVRLAAAKADAARSIPFPSTHHEQDHHMTAAAVDPTVRAEQTTELQIQNRTLEMQLLHESLARAHMQDRLQEAEHERLGLRVVRAQKLMRKAERASLRARKAIALAVM
ncbi:hypothetical protein GCM10010495_20080 [Kitasatospora herbaricolor]|uniref:hypothetical protein n=1 Tax=Kitasatospora herbaricolor TaxID=68217 RepID=UPI00174C8E3D|nr:hypothetical protein [Kitasatospora herbaricolor]MDQ0310494.1 hypothetical protein [Kitasatospora herbaricolor]GGV07684.1 hypothetical protein GCM10010495_20080 [Kitasatospora herbaricolor]